MTDTIDIDTSSFAKFSADLRRAAPELQKQLRKELKAAGELVAEDARRRAGSFSTRIPGAIKVGVAAGSSRIGKGGVKIRIYVDANKAPHGRPIEGITGNSFFRHPTDGEERQTWVNQPTRHYLRPAMQAGRITVIKGAQDAISKALREVHSHG